MKLLSRLVIALAICLMAIPMMATPVQAADYSFSLRNKTSYTGLGRDEGYVGDVVRIHGSWNKTYGKYMYIYYELYGEDKEDWYYKEVRYDYYDGTSYYFDYDFEIPESYAMRHKILICKHEYRTSGDVVDTLDFTVHPSIEIDEDEGPAGTKVKVTGYGWHWRESEIEIRFYLEDPGTTHLEDEDYYVVVASKGIEIEDDIDHHGTWKEDVTFVVPPCKKGAHWIYAVGNKNKDIKDDKIKGVEFEVLPGISLDPKSGSPGETVTVTGSGFEKDEKDIEILFDGDVVSEEKFQADEDGLWEGTFKVPEVPQGDYDVTAQGKDTDAEDIEKVEFVVVPGLVLSPAEGTEGYVDTDISVSGHGFAKSKAVTITYGGETYSSTTDTKGSFPTVTFKAKGKHGEQPIEVTDAAGNTVTATFLMESTPPPVPTLSSPATEERVGFVGKKFTPTFTWSAVTDESGVSYNLQIGTSAAFTQVLVSKTGLSEASYTLTKEEALPNGSYYWRVKAVDGAQNDSGWSVPYSFKCGILPFWAFIAVAALLVVLIGALVYLFVRGRAPYD